MGVPALFRWLSKKYPKIVLPVVEEEEVKIPDESGTEVALPVNISGPNPNGEEFDNLYLDMNGIVHPCTHPEGKPAPETEEDMMVEVFNYTERVVNMIRPRKLLFMAIDGVAPRAKMNQQRSRRFRSAMEAKEKADAHLESIQMWEAMGKTISEEEKNKKSWDSNAITPGTPFMDLLASSLRYWVARKLNTDPGWKGMEVIISDASVPGEGEHKIMDFIRRQRSNPGHDPNTRHVIYGLDADLIMLSLATHEPHFRVLREDVFFQEGSRTACRICGQEGHFAAQCTGEKAEIKKKPVEKKPFIFLDVAILREYLEAELRVANQPFPFNLEQAIDDWVLLIFFVGNDFLPHLPSLEIREGAIDTLLKIWRDELPRMGGYLTNHGQLELARAQIILEGLAKREDEIFRRRREAEERQDQNAKRRKLEKDLAESGAGPSSSLNLGAAPVTPTTHPLPAKPETSFVAKADSIGLGGVKDEEAIKNAPAAAQAISGSNSDWVHNRKALRMANLSAAEMLKAEVLMPVKQSKNARSAPAPTPAPAPAAAPVAAVEPKTEPQVDEPMPDAPAPTSDATVENDVATPNPDEPMNEVKDSPQGHKRKHEEVEVEDATIDAEDDTIAVSEDDETPPNEEGTPDLSFKVNGDGTVEQADLVKLWEPGYKERYYRQKFGAEYSDEKFRQGVAKSYIEGMAWVLTYYYQGTPSWQWYYPYHFAPFAADFEDVDKLDLKFEIGQPFKPFEQLMGVFPAASRQHIPVAFQHLMINEESPILDFYPPTFQIDMNGKRMAWQGVALLPFIDPTRLLDAMAPYHENLTEDEKRRNSWGNDVIYVSEEHPFYPSLEALYGKRKSQDPVKIDPSLSKGINGSILPNPDCLPGSTFNSPLLSVGQPDISPDRTLSAIYFFPKQLTPHRSVLLPGVKRAKPALTEEDRELARRGGRGRGRGGFHSDRGRGGYNNGRDHYSNGRDYNSRGGGDWQNGGYGGGPGGPRQHYPSNNNNNHYSRGGSYSNSSYNSHSSYQQNHYPNNPQPRGPTSPHYNNGGGFNNSYGGGPQRGRGGPPRGGGNHYGGGAGGGGYQNGGGFNQGGHYNQGGAGGYNQGGYGGYGQTNHYGGYNNNPNANAGYGGYGGGYNAGQSQGYGGYGGGAPRGNGNRGRGRGGPRY